MAATLAPPPPPPATPSLLATLKLYRTSLRSRHSLLSELEAALTSFFTKTPTPLSTLNIDADNLNRTPTSTCATESIRPPNVEELQEILRIGFEGVLEAKQEHRLIADSLEHRFQRADLKNVVERIETMEEERFKLMIERDQLRRLDMITQVGEGEFQSSLDGFEKRRRELTQKIHDEEREIDAEIVDLGAAETIDTTEQV
ncbi:BZ3500_MvSof-1268-A1-R1_Chr3-1g05508 [Microbotryum saponariae]|uniref:BZ3500_MvSof-1268-A1-R1_Chr3-1g05508 protein n=1 Tax=Microbotryum saponariae TaxID=289078 RepID=A0A2X0LFT5_9BASI|nr:BZ3500_MvSof-1268-A1-R1_Chr3-1g05508 [Microbotryum saponariae]SDA04699.1 BZ3501_MvSof-1269-A2-R1_Chr3-1g05179 [Microbotryum saponariae]